MFLHAEYVIAAVVCFFGHLSSPGSQEGITVSIFANNKQPLSNSCTQVPSSKPMTSIRCSAACGISPGCKGITCVPDSSQTCQCFLCFPRDGVGYMQLIFGGLPADVCGPPPPVLNTNITYTSTKVNSTVTYTCQLPYQYIGGTSVASCQSNGLWSAVTVACSICPAPPMIERTQARYTESTNAAVRYSCLDSDIYVRGTTDASCISGVWEQASILCAPTSCWYLANGGIPAYKGPTNITKTGNSCADWSDPLPVTKGAYYRVDTSFVMDGNRANASNFCRIFDDNYRSTWCYTLKPGLTWGDCKVPQCPSLPGVLIV